MSLEPELPGSIPSLLKQGFTRFRKPYWEEHAYLEAILSTGGPNWAPGLVAPWLTLVDPASQEALKVVGLGDGKPVQVLWIEAGVHETDWIGVQT